MIMYIVGDIADTGGIAHLLSGARTPPEKGDLSREIKGGSMEHAPSIDVCPSYDRIYYVMKYVYIYIYC